MISAFIAGATKFIAGANARWMGCLPEAKQRIYFANHTSHLDAVVVWATFPSDIRQRIHPVAAQDYWTKSSLRLYLARRVFQAILIERQNVSTRNNPLETLLHALEGGASLIIFPEGTRGNGLDVQPFKSGLYHIARQRPDLELVPVHIDNMNRVLPKGEILPVPLLSCITFGSPIHLEHESKMEFLERARKALADLKHT
ncbi:MAG: lysophospholipid acyltransferase family protein [Limisphaerales bacterium]